MANDNEKKKLKLGGRPTPPPIAAQLGLLPDELMEEILQRLPVKSIKRFECVSKSWVSFMSSPNFIKAHLKLNKSLLNQQRLLLVGRIGYPYASLWSSNRNQNDDYEDAGNVISLENLSPYRFSSVVGYCDGLVCLGLWDFDITKEFYLTNPSTKKSKKVCTPPQVLALYDFSLYGFGYGSLAHDYKLVVIMFEEVYIYDFKSQSWKRIGDFPYARVELSDESVFCNDKLHWNTSKLNGFIVSLDLASETYEELDKPCSPCWDSDYCRLGTIAEEKLSYFRIRRGFQCHVSCGL